ncbi:MAG: nucleotide sugar dehydrogenase [Alphaproteobacteria bacterium]|nr:nucleotide sugar dehydrogenase [Alphaproteobacteria bacterium]MCY4319104.1 nucleotide sugar dehydrogenase [Alphaproteobacteria bacterium]
MDEAMSGTDAAPLDALRRGLQSRRARIGVIGLGYVGLPLARAFHEAGFSVIGFDTDPEKPPLLAAARSYIMDVADGELAAMAASGRFEVTGDFIRLRDADAIAICVPTPLGPNREPDLRFVEASARAIAAALRPGQLVVLESTTWPGTTEEVVKPVLEAGGLRSGRDFFLAYAPERESPGSGERHIPRVVGADGPEALALASALYEAVAPKVHAVSSPAAAEAAKLTENVFRAVNIALVNELKGIYAALGVDVWEVVAAAGTKPFGYMPFWPGPGWGGHCIPIDPFYLAWKARSVGLPSRFIELAGEINAEMPARVIVRLEEALAPLAGTRILLVGVAYKKNIDDTRESPAFRLWELLARRGAEVAYFDPHVPALPATRAHPGLTGVPSLDGAADALVGFDAAIVVTDHDAVDWEGLAAAVPLVVDTRNVYDDRPRRARIVKA